jgi:hypothetical protein
MSTQPPLEDQALHIGLPQVGSSEPVELDIDEIQRRQIQAREERAELEREVGAHLVNHPIGRVLLAAKKLVLGKKEDLAQRQLREIEELDRENLICSQFASLQKSLDDLLPKRNALASSIDEISKSDDAAAEWLLNAIYAQRSNYNVLPLDIDFLMRAKIAANFKPALLAAFDRQVEERKRSLADFVKKNTAVLKKYSLI